MAQDNDADNIDEDAQSLSAQIGLSDAFIREIRELLASDYTDRIHEICRDLPAPDAADLIAKVGFEERHKLVEILEHDISPEAFSYLDRGVLNDLFERMSGQHIASIVNGLESDDAISLINDLDKERRGEIMRNLSRKLRAAVEEGFTFPEKSAGRLMQREFVSIPQFWTVGKTVDYLRAAADALPRKFHDVFIVDPAHRFIGAVALSHLLCAGREVKVDALVHEEHTVIPAIMGREQVAHLFRRKDLLSAPVVDQSERLIGVITVDDIVDVIDAQAQEAFLKLGGVGNSDIFSAPFSTVRARFWWLAVNLLTAFADTAVISWFEGTIEKIVVLAALMPVVASMGGNAGTQTLAVVVRALATKELTAANTLRITMKELIVGSINGVIFGLIMIAAITLWYQDLRLGLVMAAAMVLNMAAAGLAGALIPIWLYRMKFDPAHSATVFLTTVTDVVGFFAFLGLAAWLLV